MYLLFGIFLLSMILGTALYLTRHQWTQYLPAPVIDLLYHTYQRLPQTSNFLSDVESGFHSSNFNLADNINEGDSRTGLDQKAKQDVYRIMKSRGISFDEARAEYMQRTFRREGISADGLPKDPKLVTFS